MKFFERAEEIKLTNLSLQFFQQFKDNFFEEIINYYKNVKTFTINLNFLFEEDKKDKLFEKLSLFVLKENVKTFICEDAMLRTKHLDSLTKSDFLQNIMYLKLPKNNLSNQGIAVLFSQDRLRHIRKMDLSSNMITEEGAAAIAQS